MREAAPAVFFVEPARRPNGKLSAQLFLPRRLSFLLVAVSEAAAAVLPVLVVMNHFAINELIHYLKWQGGGIPRKGQRMGTRSPQQLHGC
jgi:hypothetical protein